MAYVLGFFTADGTMIRNKRGAHFIEFEITDKDLLQEIQKLLCSNHKITERNRKPNQKNSYRLQIGSKAIFSDLQKLGLTPKKSKTLTLPFVPKKYFCHFVRGYFDGDGNVTIGHYVRKDRNNKASTTLLSGFISGSKLFLQELHSLLKKYAYISHGTLYYGSGAYRLYFSVNNSKRLYEFMYDNPSSTVFLPRKKKIFESYFNLY